MLYQYKKKELEDELLIELNDILQLNLPLQRLAIHSEIILINSGDDELSEDKKAELDVLMDEKGYVYFMDM